MRRFGIALGMLLAATTSSAVELNLGGNVKTIERTAEPGVYVVEIRNFAPKQRGKYRVRVGVETRKLPALDLGIFRGSASDVVANVMSNVGREAVPFLEDKCESAIAQFAAIEDEGNVARGLINLALECDPSVVEEIREATTAREEIVVREGDKATLTVTRLDDQGAEEESWVLVLETRAGEWLASYAFAFVPDEDDLYSLQPITEGDDADKFSLRERANSRRGHQFIPAVAFSYVPAIERRYWGFTPAFTAGLGFDLDNPVGFAGISLRHWRNVSILIGAAMHKQRHLHSQYEATDVIGANLTEDQLHESTYEPNLIFGLSFNFNAAPFSLGEKKKEETAAEDQGEAEEEVEETDDGSDDDGEDAEDEGDEADEADEEEPSDDPDSGLSEEQQKTISNMKNAGTAMVAWWTDQDVKVEVVEEIEEGEPEQ